MMVAINAVCQQVTRALLRFSLVLDWWRPGRSRNLTPRQVLAYVCRMPRGLISAAGHLPHWRLQRSAVAGVLGGNRGKGSRSVASYDEDSVTMAVAAGRTALVRAGGTSPRSLWFATTSAPYAEKSSAPVAHAALRLDEDVIAADAAGGLRSANGALRSALHSSDDAVLVLAGDIRTGPAGGPDEREGGDAGAAVLVGDSDAGNLVAEYIACGSATREFLDRWRAPGELRTHGWEERFGQQRYADLADAAWTRALKEASLEADGIRSVAIVGPHARAGAKLARQLGAAGVDVADDLAATVGFSGAAHAPLVLARMVEGAEPGEVLALVSMADGADVFLFRRTEVPVDDPATVDGQIAGGDDSLPYAKYLQWRGVLPTQPPNRPEPARMSASAAERRLDWKYGFVGSVDRSSGAVHLPPARVSFRGGAVDEMDLAPMADVPARVVTFTIDSLAYSPSPPTIFAVCDFEGGGRLPVELTDVTPEGVSIGMPVEMTFRRINTADGIANYFWKARPSAAAGATKGPN
jgi:hydroxymethylglutaryl-CoA synthase